MGALTTLLIVFTGTGLVLLAMSLRNVQQYEKGVVFRFGRLLPDIRGPGLRMIRPIGDRMRKVSVQTEVLDDQVLCLGWCPGMQTGCPRSFCDE